MSQIYFLLLLKHIDFVFKCISLISDCVFAHFVSLITKHFELLLLLSVLLVDSIVLFSRVRLLIVFFWGIIVKTRLFWVWYLARNALLTYSKILAIRLLNCLKLLLDYCIVSTNLGQVLLIFSLLTQSGACRSTSRNFRRASPYTLRSARSMSAKFDLRDIMPEVMVHRFIEFTVVISSIVDRCHWLSLRFYVDILNVPHYFVSSHLPLLNLIENA